MNPETVGDAKKLFLGVKESAKHLRNVKTVLCPPAPFLSELHKIYSGSRLQLGAQNIYFEKKGSFTGEVSGEMVKSVGATYVIIGHSERRFPGEGEGETEKVVNKKILSALQSKLTVILCIGERERDTQGSYLSFLKSELLSALDGVSKTSLKKILITYEPIWAIGKTGDDAMKPSDVHETTLFLRKILAEKYDKKTALSLPFLYGGSVESVNCTKLLREGNINGFLIGHASLIISDFTDILHAANTVS